MVFRDAQRSEVSKIETRPLRLVRAQIDNESGTVILQNAETIRLMTKNGKLLSITEAKVGDENTCLCQVSVWPAFWN